MAKFKYQRPRKKYRTQTRSKLTPKPKAIKSPYDDALHVAIKACGIRTPKIGSTVSTHSKQASRLNNAKSIGKLAKRNESNYAIERGMTRANKENPNATIHGDQSNVPRNSLVNLIVSYLNN
jgi:hypothetical protein